MIFLSNLHSTETLRLLEGVQLILPKWHSHSSETEISTCQNVGQFYSHSSEVEIVEMEYREMLFQLETEHSD